MYNKLYYDQLLDFYIELLSNKQQLIAKYYYHQDLSLQEISELLAVSRAAIYDCLKRVRHELDYYESILLLYQKQQKRQKILQQIKKQIDPSIWSLLSKLETE